MSVNDRAADRQSHSHPVRFSRIERFEEPVHLLRFEPDACILYAEQGFRASIACFAAPANYQDTLRFFDCVHRIHSINDQVQQNLLSCTRSPETSGSASGNSVRMVTRREADSYRASA